MAEESGVGNLQTLKLSARATRSAHDLFLIAEWYIKRLSRYFITFCCSLAEFLRLSASLPAPCSRVPVLLVAAQLRLLCVCSKFKILEPTLLADLEKHQPEKYLKSGKSLVKQADLGTLTEGDMVRVCCFQSGRPANALAVKVCIVSRHARLPAHTAEGLRT